MPAISQRTQIGKQSEAFDESGVQVRSGDPVSPEENQIWINKTTNVIKYKDADSIHTIKDQYLPLTGDAADLGVGTVLDFAVNRIYFKDGTTDVTLTAVNNLEENMVGHLKLRNNSTNVAQVQTVTLPTPAIAGAGAYWLINGANNTNKYYVWLNLHGTATDPMIAGRTGVPVLAHSGQYETTRYTFGADAAAMTSGQYYTFSDGVVVSHNRYVWFNKDLAGGDPLVVGMVGTQVQIFTGDTADQIAAKVQLAVDALGTMSAVMGLSNQVLTTTQVFNNTLNSTNVNVPSLTVAITVNGWSTQTATEFAQATRLALDALPDFSVPNPVTPTMTITNENTGYADAAVNGNIPSGFSSSVSTPGQGRIGLNFITGPTIENVNFATGDSSNVEAQTEKIYIMRRLNDGQNTLAITTKIYNLP